MKSLSERIANNPGKYIVVDGRRVVPILRQTIPRGSRVAVTWSRWIESPTQGICLDANAGELEVAGVRARRLVLWRDTSPDRVELVASSKRPTVEVCLWNCWRDDGGVTQAWIGNAGMWVRERRKDGMSVACNSRYPISFTDLVFDIAFAP